MTLRNNKAAFAFSALAMGVAAFSVNAQAHAASQIHAVDAFSVSDDVTQLSVVFGGTPVLPVAYQQSGSNQLVLDFQQVSTNLPRNTAVYRGAVQDVVALGNSSATRLIINLNEAATYTVRVEGNRLLVDIAKMSAATPITPAQNASGDMSIAVNPLLNPQNVQQARGSYEGISSIEYTPSADGGDIRIALSDENIPVDVQRQGNKLVVRTTGANIPRHLLRRLSTEGLVASIDAKNQGQNGVVTISMQGDYEYQAYQAGSQLNISVRPPELLREPTLEEKVYTGDPLSLEFQDIPVRTVLYVLGEFTRQNIVSADSVGGNITLKLVNVPWDQALDIILKLKNLDKRTNGDVIYVAPAAELASQEAEELKAQNEIKDLAPLRTEYIRLNYAKAEAVFDLIEKAGSNSSGTSNQRSVGLLSPRGSVIVDSRTNTLIFKDTSESLENIRTMIEKIDIPVSQVMIEARIVNASDTFSKELGVRWGLVHDSAHSQRRLQAGNSMNTLWDIREAMSSGTYTHDAASGLAVDLGAENAVGRISFGLLNIADTILDLELSAMQADNRGEVISSPKVLTADKQTAKILSGTKIPYQTSALNGATTITFVDAALVLEATPNITHDGKIGLDLLVSNGRPTTATNGSIAVSEDSIETSVILEDGQTVVLGGVFRNTVSNRVSKVPFLGDLPLVGRLFKNEVRQNDKEELLIFITPKIVNDNVGRF